MELVQADLDGLLRPRHNGIMCERAEAVSGQVYLLADGWVVEATLSTVYLRRADVPELEAPANLFSYVGPDMDQNRVVEALEAARLEDEAKLVYAVFDALFGGDDYEPEITYIAAE